ncbi:MAG: ATP-binding protein [Selenomonadales bacterium]|nr:ATP-binding protein [Selenomonadales bacterium]
MKQVSEIIPQHPTAWSSSCDLEQFKADSFEEWRRKDREQAKLRRIAALRKKGIADSMLLDMTFVNDLYPDSSPSKVARAYVREFDTMLEKNAGLLFAGNCGTGKTFYAGCIVNALIDKGIPALMTTMSRIIRLPFDGFDEALRDIEAADLVVFDDLGAERDTSFAWERAFDAIDSRIRARKPIIVTTNFAPQELRAAKNIREQRIYDRILGACAVVPVTGESIRVKEQREKTNMILGLLKEV